MSCNLEIERAIEEIKKQKAKKILIQLPEGLKPQATKIVDEIEKAANVKCFVWLGSCYGACDVPDVKDFDLVIQFGHSKWPFWK